VKSRATLASELRFALRNLEWVGRKYGADSEERRQAAESYYAASKALQNHDRQRRTAR
jgi:hypothetical protein